MSGVVEGMADPLGTTRNGFRDQFVSRLEPAKQVVLRMDAGLREQPVHYGDVRFEPAVEKDMRDIQATLVERACDEKRPMAVEGLLLGAHEHNTMLRRASYDPLETLTETLRLRYTVVADAPLFVTGGVVRATAKLTAEIHVPYTACIECCGKRLAVEVGIETAVGGRSHVGQGGYAVPVQQPDESLQRVVGVPDGQDRSVSLAHAATPDQTR